MAGILDLSHYAIPIVLSVLTTMCGVYENP